LLLLFLVLRLVGVDAESKLTEASKELERKSIGLVSTVEIACGASELCELLVTKCCLDFLVEPSTEVIVTGNREDANNHLTVERSIPPQGTRTVGLFEAVTEHRLRECVEHALGALASLKHLLVNSGVLDRVHKDGKIRRDEGRKVDVVVLLEVRHSRICLTNACRKLRADLFDSSLDCTSFCLLGRLNKRPEGDMCDLVIDRDEYLFADAARSTLQQKSFTVALVAHVSTVRSHVTEGNRRLEVDLLAVGAAALLGHFDSECRLPGHGASVSGQSRLHTPKD